MAVWQFDLHLLPATEVQRYLGAVPAAMTTEVFDSEDWWKKFEQAPDLARDLSALLPPGVSWSAELELRGLGDGDRVDIWRRNGRIDSVFVRIDVRNTSRLFPSRVIDVARRYGLLLHIADGPLLQPSLPDLIAAIQQSAASRWVESPEALLDDLQKAKDSKKLA